MELSLNGLMNVFNSAPLVVMSLVGVFTIAALIYNATEQRTFQQEQDNSLVLSILSGMLILGMLIVVTQL